MGKMGLKLISDAKNDLIETDASGWFEYLILNIVLNVLLYLKFISLFPFTVLRVMGIFLVIFVFEMNF